MSKLDPTNAVLKLDFRNAFNSIRRDKMLRAVLELAPGLFHYAHSAYSLPSILYWADKTILSAEGVQQGGSFGASSFLPYHSQHVLSAGVRTEFVLPGRWHAWRKCGRSQT